MKTNYLACGLLLLAIGGGCDHGGQLAVDGGKSESSAQDATTQKPVVAKRDGIGTINLPKIAHELGLSAQVEARSKQLGSQIAALQKEKQDAFRLKQAEFGENPTADQVKELQKLAIESQAAIQRVQQQAEQQMRELNAYVMNVMNQKVTGPLEEVAEKENLAVVLRRPSEAVVFGAQEVDITDQVLEAIRKASPEGLDLSLPATNQPETAETPNTNEQPTLPTEPELPGEPGENEKQGDEAEANAENQPAAPPELP